MSGSPRTHPAPDSPATGRVSAVARGADPRSGSGHRILTADVVPFRTRLYAAVEGRYVTADSCHGVCPVCGGPIVLWFHGFAPRVTARCLDNGCTEAEIGDRLGLRERR